MKKIFALALVICMLFTALPCNAADAAAPLADSVPALAGAGIRVGDNAGLRFRTIVNKDALFDQYYQSTDENKTYVYREDNNIMFGILMLPEDYITKGSSIKEMFEQNDPSILEIQAKVIFSQDADTLAFTGVITGIPKNGDMYIKTIAAVPYIKYRENAQSQWTYIYGTQGSASYYNVAKKARETDYSNANNPSPSVEMKTIMKQLDEIIELSNDSGFIPGWY